MKDCETGMLPSQAAFFGRCSLRSQAERTTQAFVDLILSSGFLAFARHLGVLAALEDRAIEVDAVVGTSSGALVAALFQAGVPITEIARLVAARAPLHSMRLHSKPWQGAFSPRKMVQILTPYLPRTFAELPRPLAIGVCDEHGEHSLLHEGELMSALLASTAIPHLFPAVRRNGHQYVDGGVADRVGVMAWRQWRPKQEAVVHVVARTRGRTVPFDERETTLIQTPATGAKFWSLGDFAAQQAEARELAHRQLAPLRG